MLAVTASCTVQPDNKNNPNAPALDSNTMGFIQNFQKQNLYTTGTPTEKDRVTINPNTADITIPTTATMSAFGGNLTFIRSLSPTKAVYRAADGSSKDQYFLLVYDSNGSGAHPLTIKTAPPSATDNFNDSTQTQDGYGGFYK